MTSIKQTWMILQPTRGHITVAGEDLRTFDKSEWVRVVSMVNQVFILDSTYLSFKVETLILS